MLEGLNKGWGGAHLSVEREYEFGFARFYFIYDPGNFSLKILLDVMRISHGRQCSQQSVDVNI